MYSTPPSRVAGRTFLSTAGRRERGYTKELEKEIFNESIYGLLGLNTGETRAVKEAEWVKVSGRMAKRKRENTSQMEELLLLVNRTQSMKLKIKTAVSDLYRTRRRLHTVSRYICYVNV